ncbi:hypothetical protein OOK58_43330 [Streptomyces sp. NBC_01728]|uniref:hypothetical protein n=1 Tax=unclassified Streptomyces TaxID=2593676 RepID=UPI002256B774|nr:MULTISPECIES: hypothetical protein [unclassified Streptomyces]MCX4458745.1 hypothetical protein [Streptomyces sp. NBC_01719]MCX4498102.1 hypothetical protein [Streptomyces sp. NBC_01728]
MIAESSLRRDVVYGDHKDLVEEFQARVKSQNTVPAAVEQVAEQNRALKEEVGSLKADLAAERQKNKVLAKVAVELSLELEQVREELAGDSKVARLPMPRHS